MKPSLFKNDLLATSDPLYTWVFQGLWCMADRAGRLEDRPRRIHLEVNPGRAFEGTEASLAWLAEHGFILRYRHGDADYIQIINFEKHQHPHVKEPASVIPAPGVSGEPGASPVQAPCEPGANPSLSPFLIPDSPSLIERGAQARPRPSKRCPPEFELTADLLAWAEQKFPGVDIEAQTEAFRDHEFKTAHTDWPATWRSWIRKAADFGGKGAARKERGFVC